MKKNFILICSLFVAFLFVNCDNAAEIGNVNDGRPMRHIVGTNGNDVLIGTSGNDKIWGLGGNDHIEGDTGADTIYGGSGNDYIHGNGGNDVLLGEGGNDEIHPGSGTDRISFGVGEAERDTVYLTYGNDTITIDLCARGGYNPSVWTGTREIVIIPDVDHLSGTKIIKYYVNQNDVNKLQFNIVEYASSGSRFAKIEVTFDGFHVIDLYIKDYYRNSTWISGRIEKVY